MTVREGHVKGSCGIGAIDPVETMTITELQTSGQLIAAISCEIMAVGTSCYYQWLFSNFAMMQDNCRQLGKMAIRGLR